MPQRCRICKRADRAAIDSFYEKSKSLAETARAFGITKSSLYRHTLHSVDRPDPVPPPVYIEPELPPAATPEARAMTVRDGKSIDAYERLLELVDKTNNIIEKAEESDDNPLLLSAIAESRKNFEAMLKIYEAQERIRNLFASKEDVTASFTFRYLRSHYPSVLIELVEAMRQDRVREAQEG